MSKSRSLTQPVSRGGQPSDPVYKTWLTDLKARVRSVQFKAAVTVNIELLLLYWSMGEDIVKKQASARWGTGLVDQLSRDLTAEFPDMKGFSRRNLMYIQKWYSFYTQDSRLVQQAVALIVRIPWGHNIAIMSQCKSVGDALFYVKGTIEHGWSRSVLGHQIESGLHTRKGKAVNNFSATLPDSQSDLARQTLKDPYVFDFLSMSADHNERELEKSLTVHIKDFLLELGAGFAYIGKQVAIQVGEREFFIDLLFYHTHLHCYVVVELKTGDFEPEYAGKLNFYIKAVDAHLRKEGDQATIGLLLCKKKDKIVAEYALSDIHKPMGVAEYKLTDALPKIFKASLPTIKQIENELKK